jgi:hypothetical protein
VRSRWEAVLGEGGPVLEYELWEQARVQVKEAGAGGKIELFVRYRDPGPSRVQVKIRMGTYDGVGIEAFKEDGDTLEELRKSCGTERWAEFMEDLSQVHAVLDVMAS